MAQTPPADLATGNTITEAWVDAVRLCILELQPLLPMLTAGTWADFVPTWTQGAAIQIKAGGIARYTLIGKTVHAVYNLIANSAGTSGQQMALTVPIPMRTTFGAVMGVGYMYAPPHEPLLAIQTTGTTVQFVK